MFLVLVNYNNPNGEPFLPKLPFKNSVGAIWSGLSQIKLDFWLV